jgi:hypothetical protein
MSASNYYSEEGLSKGGGVLLGDDENNQACVTD